MVLLKVISREAASNFILTGIVTGVVLWAGMNLIFMITGISSATWTMGFNSLIVNLFSHIVLGIVIIYAISKSKVEVSE